ncbi:hypothetical protein QUB68_09635 [Microcoleus sp. A006_D1]|uniref:hypothetical protein n=1 Tax=Microcoleus sp. A006_D1 TaxID=3055267 RepID=UPI002FD45280
MKKSILFTLYLIPVVLLIGFVANFSINVPIDDEWRLASLFEKISAGSVTFNDFWALHSNHRILFPKLIISVLVFASQWNINYQLCLSIGLAAITFIAMYKLSSMQVKNVGDNLWHLANILTCILVFSLVQHENWLWGFQLAWFFVNLCFVAAVYTLVSTQKLLPNLRISIAAAFCFIASFSLAQGLLSWLAVIPALVAVEGNWAQKRKRAIVWLLLFVGTCAIYSIDYHPSRKTSIIWLLNKPLVVIDYFLSLLGSPIVRLPVFAAFVGLVIFASFVFFVWHFGKKILSTDLGLGWDGQDAHPTTDLGLGWDGQDAHPTTDLGWGYQGLPWLSIGLFSVLSALFITAGRAEFGAIQALESSRYTTNSILLLIALVQLGQLFVRETKELSKRNYKFIYRGFAGLLIGIIIVNSQQAIAQTSSALLYKQGAQDCLQLINYLETSEFFKNAPESCLRVLSKKTWLVREGAAIIDKLGWRKFAKNVEFISNSEKVYGYLDKPQTGDKSLNVKKKAAGWAVLPENRKQPNIVLLSVGDKQSFFANAYVNLDSPDIAKSLKSQLYNNARWAVDFSGNDLPIAQTEIKAWVYNPVDNQFVQLRGG